jgi:triacylglycerol esterase/lipase EstA (alpha/beta hydrolase family)
MSIGSVVDWAIKTGVRGAFRVALGSRDLGTPAPGAGKGHDPVILINGFSVHNEALELMARSLRRDGFTVYVPELPNNAMDEIDGTARYLAEYVERVRRETGSRKVDLVGYSEGGLVARAYAKWYGGDATVDSSISLGTPHSGVLMGGIAQVISAVGLLRAAVPEAAQDMLIGSSFMKRLNDGDRTPGAAVRYTSIFAKDWDGIVTPGSSGALEGATNIAMTSDRWFVTEGPHHLRMVGSNACYEAIRGALLTR